MERWECFSDMVAGGIDGLRDGIAGSPRSSNANRSHSYASAYGAAYTSALAHKSKLRDHGVAEDLAIKADGGKTLKGDE